jgi:hypothetical protein
MSFTPSFISFSNTTGGFLIYQWVDSTTNTPLDSTSIGVGTTVPYTDTGAQNDNVTARIIYTPNTNQTVKLYVTSANGTATLRGSIGTQAIIKPLNLSVAIQATATGTLNTDYISVGNNDAAQNVAASGTDIIFDTNIASSGIGYSTSTGVFTLTSGKTYRITSEIAFQQYSANGYLLVQLVDGSSNTAINTQVVSYPYNSGFNEVNNPVSDIIYTPTTNQTVKFRITGGSSGLTAQQRGGGFSRAVIQQIANQFALTNIGTMSTTGDITVGGNLTIGKTVASGLEGGQIDLATAPSGSLTASTVSIDIYSDKLRIFENTGNFRGAYLDITKLPSGVGGEILTKVSGIVNAGVDVTLGNLKARISSSGNRSLQVSTVTGTYSVTGSDTYSQAGVVSGSTIQANSPRTINTTPAYLNPGHSFGTDGATDTWVIYDSANNISWRITCIIGPSYVGNMITIERLL